MLPTLAELMDRNTVREGTSPGSMRITNAPRSGGGTAAPVVGKSPHDRRWSDPLPLVVATDRRGGTASDDDSLDPAGADVSGFDGRLLWHHDRHHAIGRVDAFTAEGERLVALARLDRSTDRGRRLAAEHRAGVALCASIGYEVLDRDERWWPRVTCWRLTDVSLVAPGTGVDPAAVTAAWRL